MKSYCFNINTTTYFGSGCLKEALNSEKGIIGSRTLLITTGKILDKLGFTDELCSSLETDIVRYDGVTANPDVAEIRKAIELGKNARVQSVIGFGGGSAIDAAKAAAVGIVSDIDIEDYLINGLDLPGNTLPIIAIPTTAGTGAELSKGAIVSSREKGIKSGIRGEKVAPAVAIIDPRYTFSLPINVTLETGFDVFAHAAESFCAVNANPFSEMLSEKAIKIVGESLPRLVNNIDDHEARESMSFASHIMGYNVRNIGNCLPHRLQYPLGVVTETSHGAGLIALYPAWINYESIVNNERIDTILDWLGCEKGRPIDRIRKWQKKLGISYTISELGNNATAEELTRMVAGNLKNDRLAVQENIITTIYQESM